MGVEHTTSFPSELHPGAAARSRYLHQLQATAEVNPQEMAEAGLKPEEWANTPLSEARVAWSVPEPDITAVRNLRTS